MERLNKFKAVKALAALILSLWIPAFFQEASLAHNNSSRYTAPHHRNCCCCVTSFLTPLNRQNQAHSCLTFTQGQDICSASIFWGGAVSVTGSKKLGVNNFQYKTTGNTMVISPTQVNPQFQSNLNAISASASLAQLADLDFNLAPGSPATGKGSSITSVKHLLSMP